VLNDAILLQLKPGRAIPTPALQNGQKSEAPRLFWDESGFRADVVQGTTWGVRGQTPVIRVPGQRQSVSAASAVNARGGFWFATTKEE